MFDADIDKLIGKSLFLFWITGIFGIYTIRKDTDNTMLFCLIATNLRSAGICEISEFWTSSHSFGLVNGITPSISFTAICIESVFVHQLFKGYPKILSVTS